MAEAGHKMASDTAEAAAETCACDFGLDVGMVQVVAGDSDVHCNNDPDDDSGIRVPVTTSLLAAGSSTRLAPFCSAWTGSQPHAGPEVRRPHPCLVVSQCLQDTGLMSTKTPFAIEAKDAVLLLPLHHRRQKELFHSML